jgi:hypothetical protein
MILKKLITFFTFFLILLFLFPKFESKAGGEFATSFEIDYSVADDGVTTITNKVQLLNLTSQYYSSEYNLDLGDIKISDFSAFGNSGVLEANQSYENKNTSISVKFKDKIVGKDKSRLFTISYKTKDLSQKSGRILEVNIPKVGSIADIRDYKARLAVPVTFGDMAYVSPQPESVKKNSFENSWIPKNLYYFNKESLSQNGISAAFGDSQSLKFDLKYDLVNESFSSSELPITIPQDTAYQKVYISSIDPKPQKIEVDPDGNWIATFKLSSRQNLQVFVKGFAQIFPLPLVFGSKQLSEPESIYLEPQKYWESEDSQMIEKAKQLGSARKIYDFVVKFLELNDNSSNNERKGGKAALVNSKDINLEDFSDLFITLCRAAKIPAREEVGVIVSSKGNFIHSWSQIWDEKLGWVQIDPGLGKNSGDVDYFSKLDFNHFSLVTHGISSELPKTANDVKVEFVDNLPVNEGGIQISFDFPKYPISMFKSNVSLVLENNSNIAVYDRQISFNIKGAKLLSDNQASVDIIPPFSKKEIPIVIKPNNFFIGQNINIEAKVNDKLLLAEFKTKSAWVLLVGIFILTCAFTFGIYQLFLITRKIRWPKKNG